MKLSMFIGAGSGKSTKRIFTGGESLEKPFVELSGKASLEHVLDSAMGTESIKDIYVWGDPQKLLRIKRRYNRKKVIVVPQKERITDSIYETFMNHYIPRQEHLPIFKGQTQRWKDVKSYVKRNGGCLDEAILLSTSDIPLVNPADYDNMVRNFDERKLDFLVGMGSKDTMENKLGEAGVDYSSIKDLYKCYQFNSFEGRLNNMFVFKPLKLSLNIIRFIQETYNCRYQYRFSNMLSLAMKIATCCIKETAQHPSIVWHGSRALGLYGMVNLAKTPWVKRDLPNLYRYANKRSSIQGLESIATGSMRGKFGVYTGGSFGSVMDIDEDESYDFFEKQGNFAALEPKKWESVQYTK